jgi:glucan 1,3-beta-glucosidase
MRRTSLALALAGAVAHGSSSSLAPVDSSSSSSSLVAPDGAPFRGVNLGGWLVVESWIRPTLFSNNSVPGGLGEGQFCAQVGGAAACRPILDAHRDAWVSQADLAALAGAGITHLRAPIGYWILGSPYLRPTDGPFDDGGWPFLVRMLGWAADLGLQVLVDLHGAPGSQNGHDHSGWAGNISWLEGDNMNRTVDVLVALAQNFTVINDGLRDRLLSAWARTGDPRGGLRPRSRVAAAAPAADVVFALELLNEPGTTQVNGPISFDLLAAWYKTAVDAVRGEGGWTGEIFLHDGFNGDAPQWAHLLPPPAYTGIYLDSHLYHCFGGPMTDLPPWGHANYACTVDGAALARRTDRPWGLAGEWSLSLPDKVSPPYPFDAEATALYRAFYEAQMSAYGAFSDFSSSSTPRGAFFWCHRTELEENAPWSFLRGIADGYIPSNITAAAASPYRFDCDAFAAAAGAGAGAGGGGAKGRREL